MIAAHSAICAAPSATIAYGAILRTVMLREAPASITATEYAGVSCTLGMWVYGDGSKNLLGVRYADSGGQQFEDVPAGSTYYTYTYRLVSRGVMGGYQCGGPGEPCVPPANLPYFRPNNNATRGQTSKIVSNTFFPDCQTP